MPAAVQLATSRKLLCFGANHSLLNLNSGASLPLQSMLRRGVWQQIGLKHTQWTQNLVHGPSILG